MAALAIVKRIPVAALAALAMIGLPDAAFACTGQVSVCGKSTKGAFPLIRSGKPVTIFVDAEADEAVNHAARSFADDLGRVSGTAVKVTSDVSTLSGEVVIIGEKGHSAMIDRLEAAGLLPLASITGGWEAYRQQVIDRPFGNVTRALVIAGSDRRGAIYGAFDISEKMGVSPWHWWADVPVVRRNSLYLTAGSHEDAPKVRYRGFFINDEDPALSGWARRAFGGVNADMYEQVFDLLLRLKGNYLWPAMWGKAFNVDDPRNIALADSMGVVMGTSHHEPLTRAQAEWDGAIMGPWNYATNGEALRKFWRGGVERMMSKGEGESYDSLHTIGMRGDGDEPMTEGTAIGLLENIVTDQRRIIADVTGKPAKETPQVWALYKEVQDYYDKGMRVPDDVILLFSDDNWGQIRRLPAVDSEARSGGYGVYYHFDYVGGPRSYRWLNSNQIEKTWQQMDLAWQRGARTLWIVNVGDIKPMEYPLSFFMDQAWNPVAMTPEILAQWPRRWAERTFGPAHSKEIAELVTEFSKLSARRKPELVEARSFPLGDVTGQALDGGEFGRIVDEWRDLSARAEAVKTQLPADQRDAFFQLVEHPILAIGNIYELQYAAAWNGKLAAVGDGRANHFADEVERLFARDAEIERRYNVLGNGKWDGIVNQPHIGYSSWDAPKQDIKPDVVRVTGGGDKEIRWFSRPDARVSYSIEAPDYARSFGGSGLEWAAVENLGRTKGAVLALPQGQAATTVQDGVRLEYDLDLASGDTRIGLVMVPTLDTLAQGGVRIGVSLDNGPVTVLSSTLKATGVEPVNQDEADWEDAVRDNAHTLTAQFKVAVAGKHVLKIWRLDDNAILQRIVIGPETPDYLGPPARQ